MPALSVTSGHDGDPEWIDWKERKKKLWSAMSSLEVQLHDQEQYVERLLQQKERQTVGSTPATQMPAPASLQEDLSEEDDDILGELGTFASSESSPVVNWRRVLVSEVGRPDEPLPVLPSAPAAAGGLTKCWTENELETRSGSNGRSSDMKPETSTGRKGQGKADTKALDKMEYGPHGWHAKSETDLGKVASSRSMFSRFANSVRVSVDSQENDSLVLARRKQFQMMLFAWINWWADIREPQRSGRVHKIISSNNFDTLCAAVITLNALYTGVAADHEIQNLTGEPTTTMLVVEIVFLSFYIVELSLKFLVHRQFLFCNEDMGWNLFDLILVLLAFVDIVAVHLGGGGGSNMNFARSLRIFKMGKILRMFRVIRFLRELRVMVASIIGSFVSLFWSLVMLSMIIYLFALIFVQAMTLHLAGMGDSIDALEEARAMHYFGGVAKTSKTLYQVTTGGLDWENVYDILEPCGWIYTIAFVFYIAFWTFAVMNILTGIFVDNALKLAAPDREQVMMEQRRKLAADGEELQKLCQAMDLDDSGTLTLEEFASCLEDDRVAHYLSTLGLEVKDAGLFFRTMCEVYGEEELEIEDFVHHCMRMKGTATSIDLQGLAFQTKLISRDLEWFLLEFGTQMQELPKRIRNGEAGSEARDSQNSMSPQVKRQTTRVRQSSRPRRTLQGRSSGCSNVGGNRDSNTNVRSSQSLESGSISFSGGQLAPSASAAGRLSRNSDQSQAMDMQAAASRRKSVCAFVEARIAETGEQGVKDLRRRSGLFNLLRPP